MPRPARSDRRQPRLLPSIQNAAALGTPCTTSGRSRPRGPGTDLRGPEPVIATSASDRRQYEPIQTTRPEAQTKRDIS